MDHDKALKYLSGAFDAIPNADELLQLVELEFIKKDAVQNQQNKVGNSLRLMKRSSRRKMLRHYRVVICA